MGSRNKPKRKPKDKFIIPTPDLIGGGGSSRRQDIISAICEIAFNVPIKETAFTKPGVKVYMEKKQALYQVYLQGETIAALTARQTKMVDECARLDVRYSGEIVNDKKRFYAKFSRIAR